MKIAVCVSGIPKLGNNLGSLKWYNEVLKTKFPSADFYYATWNDYKEQFQYVFPKYDCLFSEQPTTYHPYYDLDSANYVSPYVKETFDWIKRMGQGKKDWSAHHLKQILIHSALVKSLPNEYDVIIRARYDSVISKNADFTPYILDTFTNKRANGFAVTRREKFDDMYVTNLVDDPKMKVWMLDQLIIHHRDNINIDYIDQLYQQKKLNPAEHGWYQVLSEPYGSNHINHHGWVNHDKNVMDQFFKVR